MRLGHTLCAVTRGMLMNRSGPVVAPLILTISLLAGCTSHRPPLAPASPPAVAAYEPEPVAETDTRPAPEAPPAPLETVAPAPVLTDARAEPMPRQGEPETSTSNGGPASGHAEERERTAILVVSEPAGGMVVVDGRPVGPAPLEVRVPVTESGYLSRSVSVKVRFLAGGTTAQSHTVELMLTPLDRVPTRLDFSPDGTRRTLASFK